MNTATATPATISRADLPAAIGMPFAGGFYGGLIHVDGVLRAQAWAPKAEGQRKDVWLPRDPGRIIAPHCSDSLANTRAMAEAGSPLAEQVLALRIGGFDDWAIPARDVLELAYRHLKPTTRETYASFRDGDNPSSLPPGYPYTKETPAQTEVAAFREGGAEAFEPGWHWASTQYSADSAWGQYFILGSQNLSSLGYEAWCRPVRSIQVVGA